MLKSRPSNNAILEIILGIIWGYQRVKWPKLSRIPKKTTFYSKTFLGGLKLWFSTNRKMMNIRLKDFEIFVSFDHIFTLLFEIFRPLKVGMTPLVQKFELQIQVFDSWNTAEQKIMGLASPLGSMNGV